MGNADMQLQNDRSFREQMGHLAPDLSSNQLDPFCLVVVLASANMSESTACLPRSPLSRCIWSAVGNLSTAFSGGGDAEARRLVEDDLRYIDDDSFGSWIGGGGELAPREGEGASSVMQAVDEGISGLIRSAAHLRYENTHSEILST